MDLFTITVDCSALEDEANALGERCEQLLSSGIIAAVGTAVESGASYARTNHGYKDQTGALTASIGFGLDATTSNGAAGYIEAAEKYASLVERGTKAHDIWPKEGHGFEGPLRKGQSRRKKDDIGTHRVALRWTSGGQTHFAKMVHHPGTEAIPFMKDAGDAAALVLDHEIDQVVQAVSRLIEG